jgi:hypothetical protein
MLVHLTENTQRFSDKSDAETKGRSAASRSSARPVLSDIRSAGAGNGAAPAGYA